MASEQAPGETITPQLSAAQASRVSTPRLSDWERLAHVRGPNLPQWLLFSALAAGGMLYASPLQHASVITSAAAVLLSPAIFLLGWMLGASVFSISCEHFRRLHRTWPLRLLLPVGIASVVGLGVLGGSYWWALAIGLLIIGQRNGTRRAWWGAVATLAFVFRTEPGFSSRPIASTDEEALAKAAEAVTQEIRSKRRG